MTSLFKFNLNKQKGVIYESKDQSINKFSIKKSKHSLFKKEINGYKWYLSKLKKKNINYPIISDNKSSVKFTLIKGKKYKFWKSFVSNQKLINEIFNHYVSVWPKKKYVPFHGDLTLENVLFLEKNKVIFIDWEYFRKREVWGLDLCYFLISLIALPAIYRKEDKIDHQDLKYFLRLWKKFFYKKNFYYLRDPINYICKKLKRDKKNFFFKIDYKIKKQITNAINQINKI